ncbi:MAG: hypothetical protein IKP23_02645 [Elusimicrobiaceae bacterium]|nr:hypothetical protein [Elusimicrobiaceae bacterium]
MTGILVVVVLLVVFAVGYFISVNNTEIRLRNLVKAQQEVCEANFDKMWKVIKQITNVSDTYLNAFKEIYPKLIEGRYQGKDISFIVEHNPPLDTSVLQQLATAIEINREEFFSHQRLLVARHNEHKTFIQSFPANILLPNAKEIKITVIKSDHTADVYATGKENI